MHRSNLGTSRSVSWAGRSVSWAGRTVVLVLVAALIMPVLLIGPTSAVEAKAQPALLALAARRPVRGVFTREEMFSAGGTRVPFVIYLKDGVKRDGTLVAREMRALLNVGAYADAGVSPQDRIPSG